MATTNIKLEARQIIDRLAEDATWRDLLYEIYVRQAIEDGITDAEASRMTDVDDLRAEFGLPS